MTRRQKGRDLLAAAVAQAETTGEIVEIGRVPGGEILQIDGHVMGGVESKCAQTPREFRPHLLVAHAARAIGLDLGAQLLLAAQRGLHQNAARAVAAGPAIPDLAGRRRQHPVPPRVVRRGAAGCCSRTAGGVARRSPKNARSAASATTASPARTGFRRRGGRGPGFERHDRRQVGPLRPAATEPWSMALWSSDEDRRSRSLASALARSNRSWSSRRSSRAACSRAESSASRRA